MSIASDKSEHQALARKYRPQSFNDVVGQDNVVKALSNTINANRLHHAYLLTGTRGIGKTTIARIIAKALLCNCGISSNPCGKCQACLEIAQGTYPDVIEIDAASQTKVEDTRQLLENTQYPPVLGRFKIYIIDEVHMLTNSSFNALLKTLEEPPAYVKFILATTDPQKIPATVLSRCIQFKLRALSEDEIKHRIMSIAQIEQINASDDVLSLIARAAKGSMRDALSLTDQALGLSNGSLDNKEVVLSMLGIADSSLIVSMLELLANPDLLASKLELIVANCPNYKNVMEQLAIALHDIAIYQLIGNNNLNIFSLDKQVLEEYAGKILPKDIQIYYQIAIETLKEFQGPIDARMVFEMALVRMIAFLPEKKNFG